MSYCERCDRYFPHDAALDQHVRNNQNHNYCGICERDFSSHRALEQHRLNSARHDWCGSCQTEFSTRSDLNDHLRDEHYWCRACNTYCSSKYMWNTHINAYHYYCPTHDRYFQSPNNLSEHLRSKQHVSLNSQCPFCKQPFRSSGDVLLHLEAGKCVSGLTRHQINRYAAEQDSGTHSITKPSARKLIAASPEYFASERSWNARAGAYECVLCHRTFGTLPRLNTHLQSPAHDAAIYRCPKKDCAREYKTLSGLCQHVESESCGVMRFREVQDAIDGLMNGMRRLTFR